MRKVASCHSLSVITPPTRGRWGDSHSPCLQEETDNRRCIERCVQQQRRRDAMRAPIQHAERQCEEEQRNRIGSNRHAKPIYRRKQISLQQQQRRRDGQKRQDRQFGVGGELSRLPAQVRGGGLRQTAIRQVPQQTSPGRRRFVRETSQSKPAATAARGRSERGSRQKGPPARRWASTTTAAGAGRDTCGDGGSRRLPANLAGGRGT